jgi:hypothetical protein
MSRIDDGSLGIGTAYPHLKRPNVARFCSPGRQPMAYCAWVAR